MTTNGQPQQNVKAETIVVGVDLTASGLAALEEALRRGAAPNVTVHVVYALDQAADAGFADGLPRVERALKEGADRLREHLDKAAALEIFGRGVRAHVRLEAPVHAILQLAVDVDADLIVVGAEKRKGLNALLHSSVGMAIATQAHCPVLVARPKDYRNVEQTPHILPLCEACREIRLATDDQTAWCEQHAATRHFARHTYGYSREHSLRGSAPQREMPIT
jgi:nucleotide-binding universal stress UspA family protein